jgi:hypothetical protein
LTARFDVAGGECAVTIPGSDFDLSVPSTARMYDYYLGGKDNR